ncbi:MAG: polysaccharide biosynthesis protein [bacterium]|nr:polysaccharide biosynthesis protein [bacterium]
MLYLFDKFKDITGLGRLSRRLKAWVVGQPRSTRRWIVMSVDLLGLLFVMVSLIYMRIFAAPGFQAPTIRTILLLVALPFLSVGSFRLLGLYRLVTRHVGNKGLLRIAYSLLAAIMLWSFVIFLLDWRGSLSILPRTVIIAYFFLGWAMIFSIRDLVRWWLRDRPIIEIERMEEDKKNVLIYGAGEAGLMLLKTLNQSGYYNVLGFFDDDKSLWSMKMGGFKVHRFDQFDKLIKEDGVCEVFITIPSLSRLQKRKIIKKLEPYPVNVSILPELADIATGRIQISDLRNVEINDLMGRDPVQPIQELMQRNISGKSVMITGAGGSIGSEIVHQVFALNPARIVLLELSEYALYQVEKDLDKKIEVLCKFQSKFPKGTFVPAIVGVLGSVGDEDLVRNLIISHKIETIYHAAAFKHIPLLETNISAALKNNTLATAKLARVAQECSVERMVLISSDKAVRPANVKGASNRLQEIVLQGMAQEPNSKTVFTVVRFGNVLDSSGSVVPRFREQIEEGGPVTITHPEIIRYFMSITEAAELVIQAGALAKSGELYVLDMGQPVKIDDLARQMIRLSGKEVADDDNPNGDIELKYIGLRSGDKMYEELLITGNLVGTKHPFILLLNEAPTLSPEDSLIMLKQFDMAVVNDDIGKIQALLVQYVEGYSSYSEINTPSGKMIEAKEGEVVALSSFKLH